MTSRVSGLVDDQSGDNEIYWTGPGGPSHLGAFVELDVSALYGLVSNAQFFRRSTTDGEQWAVKGSYVAASDWFWGSPRLTGFDQDPQISSISVLTNITIPIARHRRQSSTGNVLDAGLALTPVPKPGTWATMLLGLGAVGFAMLRRKQTELTCRRSALDHDTIEMGCRREKRRHFRMRANVSVPPMPAISVVAAFDPLQTFGNYAFTRHS